MKKNLLILSLITLPFCANAQIFQENFDGNGPGIQAWTVIDGDNNTVAPALSYFTNAWITNDRGGATPNFGGPDGDFAAMSTSWYATPGTSNDWLISPQVNITGTSPYLFWDAKAQDEDYRDGYKVMLSTTGGNQIADFDVELFSVTSEDAEWVTRKVNLSAYIGQNITFAFVNNSTDQYVLLVDNVKIQEFEAPAVPGCSVITSPANGAVNVEYDPAIVLAWNAPTTGGAVTGYDVAFGTDASALPILGTASATTVNITSASPSTTYYWQIIPKNDGGSATGCEISSFTTKSSPYEPYCGPVSFMFAEAITNVTFAGINNTTSAASTDSHELFLDQVAEVTPGETYTISLKGTTEGDYDNRFHVFIDWNQNGIFDANETYIPETVLENSTGEDEKVVTMDIQVPADAIVGNTRLRVKKTYGVSPYPDPCSSESFFGQVEDYTVNVGALSISDVTKSSIQVYPNPVVDFLNVSTNTDAKQITVTDITGKKLMDTKVASKSNTIDMTALQSGVYIITVETAEGVQSHKVIKK